MLKVLIIDDEPNVRKGLKILVPWEENGFEICGDSGDPDEGLSLIMSMEPDIVLIDIKMPGRLGLDIIREVRENGFSGKFIIVSGYSNFDYAKDAIRYGVKSYILKPVDEDELMEIILKLKEEIAQDRKWEKDKKIVEEDAIRNLLLEGNKELEEKLCKYDSFQTAIIFDEYSKSNDKAARKLESLIKEKLNKYADDVDVIRMNNYVALLFKDFRNSRVNRILLDLKIRISSEIGRNICITLGSECDNPVFISHSYKEAEKLLNYKFIYFEKEILSVDTVKEEEKLISTEKINSEKLYSYIEVNDIESINDYLIKIKNNVILEKLSEDEIKISAIKLFLGLVGKLSKDYDLKMENFFDEENIVRDINNINSLKSLIKYLSNNFIEISTRIGEKSSYGIINKMVVYINKNYYRDLKLEGLAEIFNYNSAYLGKLFKNEVGENFNTYFDKVRIKEAKTLLLGEQLKVYEVSEKVGYKNIDYFHSKFKKYVGMSPMNYKKKSEKI